MTDLFEANVKIKALPRRTDNILNALANVHGKLKWQIVRDALMEYAENHKQEIMEVVQQ